MFFTVQAGALGILQSILDTGVENVATDRAKYILTWMTVGADQDDFRAPKGEKTFDGSLSCSDATVLLGHAARFTDVCRASHVLVSCMCEIPSPIVFFSIPQLAYTDCYQWQMYLRTTTSNSQEPAIKSCARKTPRSIEISETTVVHCIFCWHPQHTCCTPAAFVPD